MTESTNPIPQEDIELYIELLERYLELVEARLDTLIQTTELV